MKRKLARYRGERASQMASFEERVKRKVSDMISRTSNEEMRLLENRHRHEKQDTIQRIENLEKLYQKNHLVMSEKINEVKDANRDLIQKLNTKEKDISEMKNLFKKLTKVKEPRNINYKSKDLKGTNTRGTKKTYKIRNEQKINKVINALTNIKESPVKAVLDQEICKSASEENQQSESKEAINEVFPPNVYNNDYLSVQDDQIQNSSKLDSTETHGSHISPKLSEVQNKENAVSQNSLVKSFRFAIEMGDKILLYDKDPRLRMNLGSKFRLSNKFGCLRNEMLDEREI